MATKARWHTEIEVPDAEGDPFDEVRVEDVGFPIELGHDQARLNERLMGLVNREGELHSVGIVCAIKDRADTACSACPISSHETPGGGIGALCRTGREQEQVQTELAVAREATRADNDG